MSNPSGYPDQFEGFNQNCKDPDLMEDIRRVIDDHGYSGNFILVTREGENMEIHSLMRPNLFQVAAHAVADVALQIE